MVYATFFLQITIDEFLVGSYQLQLSRLRFISGREPNDTAIKQLTELFRLSCDPQQHRIPVVVSPEELQVVLEESAVTIGNIAGHHTPLPKLSPSGKLRCIHGRQRFEAAILMNGPHMWWGVQLYCIPSGSSFRQLLPKVVDQYFYQTPPSDGEVFLRVRNYEESGNTREAALWRLKLSKYKQKILRAVQRDGRLLEKLNQLHPFHGLWDSFQLGNMERHMAIHATDEVSHKGRSHDIPRHAMPRSRSRGWTHPEFFGGMAWHGGIHPRSLGGMAWHGRIHSESFGGMGWDGRTHPKYFRGMAWRGKAQSSRGMAWLVAWLEDPKTVICGSISDARFSVVCPL